MGAQTSSAPGSLPQTPSTSTVCFRPVQQIAAASLSLAFWGEVLFKSINLTLQWIQCDASRLSKVSDLIPDVLLIHSPNDQAARVNSSTFCRAAFLQMSLKTEEAAEGGSVMI